MFLYHSEKTQLVTVEIAQGPKLILRKLTMQEMQDLASTGNRKGRPALSSYLRSEFQKSALVSNTVFGAILLCLEKFIEKEFACPCRVEWNVVFATAYFLVPAVAVFVLMMKIKGCQCEKSKETCKTVSSSIVPALFWIIIVLWDGHSVACMKTTWSGSYVEIDKAAPEKWCRPANLTSSQELDYKTKTQGSFFVSQLIGMGLITFIIVLNLCFKCCCQQEDKDAEAQPLPN